MDIKEIANKYRVSAPRYTSYPTVPFWDEDSYSEQKWVNNLVQANDKSGDGISLYIHLPFCESLCTYCGCNTRITKNHGVEKPYINAVLKEWLLYVDLLGSRPLIKEIHLGGGTPTFFSAENLEMLINGLLAISELHEEAEFSFEAHPDNTTSEHLSTLYALGFRRLSLGIQDFDPTVQFMINRFQSSKDVARITAEARKMGYTSINYDLIYGLPMQSLAGMHDTIDTVIRLKPDRIAFYSYAHVPWLKPGQRRYTEEHLPSPELKNELYESGFKKLVAAGYASIGMDHFTLKSDSLYLASKNGKLHRNFMGYTAHVTNITVGLGVSAISDCWTAFSQNVKSVEDYLAMLEEGKLPLLKGHVLTHTDLVIRKHILNIMCNGRTSWDFANDWDDTLNDCLARVRWLVHDGLVLLSGSELQVTHYGMKFLRNICMAFDARMGANKPVTQLFSLAD